MQKVFFINAYMLSLFFSCFTTIAALIFAMRSYTRDEKILKEFGRHLRKLREEKKISQAKLALAINSYQSTIFRIEHGEINPTLGMLTAIAHELNIKPKDLLDFI